MKFINGQRGTSLLEFAIVFPLYIAVVIGIMNFAILLNNSIVAKAASRDAANVIAATGNHTRALAKGNETLDIGGLGGTSSIALDYTRVGVNRVKSVVTYTVPNLIPGLGALLGGSPLDSTTKLQGSTDYYVEYPIRTDYKKPQPRCVACTCRGDCDW
ncbi:MAG: pilus assembly protein [Firmicutes bacterium]|nr:pilus assembly protein [Bacillota bacterium]